MELLLTLMLLVVGPLTLLSALYLLVFWTDTLLAKRKWVYPSGAKSGATMDSFPGNEATSIDLELESILESCAYTWSQLTGARRVHDYAVIWLAGAVLCFVGPWLGAHLDSAGGGECPGSPGANGRLGALLLATVFTCIASGRILLRHSVATRLCFALASGVFVGVPTVFLSLLC